MSTFSISTLSIKFPEGLLGEQIHITFVFWSQAASILLADI
jgi:hypothetical protein